MSKPQSVFARYERKAWPHVFRGRIVVDYLVGGTPFDEKTVEGWLKKNLGWDNEALLQQAVAEVLAEAAEKGEQIDTETAAARAASNTNLNVFKRDDDGLYIEGRQLKACLKEAASVAVAGGRLDKGRKWGATQKGLIGFLAEHIFVVEDRLHVGRAQADGVHTRFVHTFRGSGIQCEEYVEKAELAFTIETDHSFTDEQWAQIWLTAERQGIGATRSQGYGRFTVTQWEKAESRAAA